jgi:glycosyltransferase involved in cell wall biosynthesis
MHEPDRSHGPQASAAEERSDRERSRWAVRVLVFIVLYESERQIEQTLDRVPQALIDSNDVDFLVIDDASPDASAERALDWARRRGVHRLTLLRNPVNQGYGGNQKLGYRLAIDDGYDFVILLHGDGQYAPELLPEFIRLFRDTAADVVLGTRMGSIASARAGGMPWYKVFGNRILTGIQNILTGRHLVEYHTGYRGYSTSFLRSIPFEQDSNDFHFDTEILLQAFHVDAKIEQFAIPTHYGDEICHVNGLRYAWDVLQSTLRFRLHHMGMWCSLAYRNLSAAEPRRKTQYGYASQVAAVNAVRRLGATTALDLGCGAGCVARELQRGGMQVTGVDAREPPPGMMTRFVRAELESGKLPVDTFDFDAVLMVDVIERLAEPEHFLLGLRHSSEARPNVRASPAFVITTPNVAFIVMRLNLLAGRFTYAERGILDLKHKRLFTRSTLRDAIMETGYVIERCDPIGVPFEAVIGGSVGRWLGAGSQLLARLWPTMFAFQFLVVARPRPGVRQVLMQSQTVQRGAVAVAGRASEPSP